MPIEWVDENKAYFQSLRDGFDRILRVAEEARGKGLDAARKPESYVAQDLAERVEKAVGPPGIAPRIRELSTLMQRELVALKVAEEIALAGSTSDPERAAEQAVRTAAAILDEGVTAAPIQGISSVRLKPNADGGRHVAVYFAGPIRSAGGTDMALILVIADYVRHELGLGRYKATELAAKRFVEELRLYEREVARFQFKVSDEELFNAILCLPVEVNGVETDPVEVTSYRNVAGVETNRVRGGALRVVHDGLIGRSQKVLKIVEALGIEGWNWLRDIKPPSSEAEDAREFMFMEDVVGGRPIFSFPQNPGGFRLRYGRSRNTGLAALGLHPSTMLILRRFIGVGTQLRTEKPGKAGVVTTVTSIEPPVVKLKDGSVIRLGDPREAERMIDSVDKVLFLGDILIGVGEFLENNRSLLPSGFVEEWWGGMLQLHASTGDGELDQLAEKTGIDASRLRSFIENPESTIPTPEEALQLAKETVVPLHPQYTYFWENIDGDQFDRLREPLLDTNLTTISTEGIATRCEDGCKILLEALCVPHRIENGRIHIPGDVSKILAACFGLRGSVNRVEGRDVFEKIANVSGIRVMRKAPIYVGARMGRPEKAKPREMRPPVHCLFPVGLAGGSRRNIVEAASREAAVSVELTAGKCRECGHITHANLCERCGGEIDRIHFCVNCGRESAKDFCEACKGPVKSYSQRTVPLKELLKIAQRNLSLPGTPATVKGVRGLTNETRTPEPLEKGLLRAKFGVSVFKDGTIRFDATNTPLTQFTPREAGAPIEKLHQLGYLFDVNWDPLSSEDQCCALRVQDVIIPSSAAEYLLKVAAFLDGLLERYYKLPAFYNLKERADLIGQLIVGLSPHTSVGVVGRIVGFTSGSVCYGHPFWHATKRRDCDGDEDSISLALDVLLNFSRSFLPSRIGGIMDAPLLLTVTLKPTEIARQAFNLEVISRFPPRFFEETWKRADPKTTSLIVETVQERISSGRTLESLGFTHGTVNIDEGNLESAYKRLGSMLDKVTQQLALAESLKSVDAADVARRVLSTHFMRDLTGNLKAFTGQRFRCVKCNAKFRRIPLKGTCLRCGGKLSLTVYRASVEKYLTVAEDLVKRYKLGPYHEQRLLLLRSEIGSVFAEPAKTERQPSLAEFV